MQERDGSSRREFIARAAGASVAAGAAVRRATAQGSAKGANEIIQLGVIGLGNNGRGHLRGLDSLANLARVAAVCDIYKPRLEQGVAMTGAKGYHNYEDLLADPDIDAVIISTPDHWHAQMAIDAMRAGKDVDVEKPMALTIEEARRMVEVAKETGRILAVDSEHTAHGIWKVAKEAVDGGALGKLLWSQTSRSRNSTEPPWNYKLEEEATPENIDWERWLGPTEKVPFDRERFFRWRKYFEYGGGIATDLYVHHLTPLVKVTSAGFPERAVGAGGNWFYGKETIEVPDTFVMALDYPNQQTIVVGGSLANSVEMPIVIRGHEANILFFGSDHKRPAYLHIQPEAAFAEKVRARVEELGIEGRWLEMGAGEQADFDRLPRAEQEQMIANALGDAEIKAEWDAAVKRTPSLESSPAERRRFFARLFRRRASASGAAGFRMDSPAAESFHENFLRCVRTREKPVLDGELGYMVQVAVNMAVESYRRDKVVFFDVEEGRMVWERGGD